MQISTAQARGSAPSLTRKAGTRLGALKWLLGALGIRSQFPNLGLQQEAVELCLAYCRPLLNFKYYWTWRISIASITLSGKRIVHFIHSIYSAYIVYIYSIYR